LDEDEVLLDDSIRLVEHAVAARVDAELDIRQGMVHGFVGVIGRFAAMIRQDQDIELFLFKNPSGPCANLLKWRRHGTS
jgi:epsilon-lactone hydrolase